MGRWSSRRSPTRRTSNTSETATLVARTTMMGARTGKAVPSAMPQTQGASGTSCTCPLPQHFRILILGVCFRFLMLSGRNVCVYWLLGECHFSDERCFYAHDKSYLPAKGWWMNKHRLARLCKEFDGAVAAAPRPGVKEGILAEALKPVSWRKDAWTLTPVDYAELAKIRAEEIRYNAMGAGDVVW